MTDAPLDPRWREVMNRAMHALDTTLNPQSPGKPRTIGVVLLLFNYEPTPGRPRVNYISNQADRADMAEVFREMANRFEARP